MGEFNLLFLAPNWRVSLIREFEKSRDKNHFQSKLVCADSDPYSPALKVGNSAHVIPRFSSSNCFENILSVCRVERIHAILPLMNLAVDFLDQHRKAFIQNGIRPIINSSETIDICHDKFKLARFCETHNIDTPITTDLHDSVTSFPLIAKPRRGEGGKNNWVIRDQLDLEYCRLKFPDHILQQYAEGREFTIDWYSNFKGMPLAIVPRERLTVRAGEVMVGKICLDKKLKETALKIGQTLNLKGPCTLQGFLLRNDNFLLTDVNLRFGSGSVHSIASGADFPFLLMKNLQGESPPVLRQINNGLVMSRFSDAFFFED